MTPLLFLGIAVAGGIGAACRLVLDGVLRSRIVSAFPWATTIVNVSGSLLLGFAVGIADAGLLPAGAHLVVGTGFLGGYTTFSTASAETVRLLLERRITAGLASGFGMLLLSVAAAAVGFWLGMLA
ncbi:fluoride efflux transporter FluC [Agromyces sp. SYSU T00194]|uniref:fluoride efflux transporter FluC n=1 Tax=Agromyces chitinivorans TaxID=3158560 RepID=UPI0033964D3F